MLNSRLGSSVGIHLLLAALAFVSFKVVHRVERQKNVEQLIFPAEVQLEPQHIVKAAASTQPSAPLTMARLAVAAPSTLHITRTVDEKPALRQLDFPGAVELPW
jgi:hypothetical protein